MDKFTDKQLKIQAKKQVSFLTKIYPYLTEDQWQEGCMELRPIKRDPALKKDFVKSYNAWRMTDTDQEKLVDFLGLINGKGYCLYYSVFAFDRDLKAVRTDGKPFQVGKVNKQNALFTSILALDLDGITEKEYKEHKALLETVGIETIDIATGHGYQLIVLLEHKVYDKEILGKFTRLLISKGFKADTSIQDPAQVLRMPYSFNYKCLDPHNKYFGVEEPIPVQVVVDTDKRYHVTDVFKAIQSLPEVIPTTEQLTAIDLAQIKIEPFKTAGQEKREIKEVGNICVQGLRQQYSMLAWDRLEEPVQKMLAGSQQGIRNQAMLFLIPFLRNSLGLNLQTIKQVMVIWGSRCTPKLDKEYVLKEVDRLYGYGVKAKAGTYTAELAQAYGYLELGLYKRENKVLIPAEIFEDYAVMADGAVKIYMALKLAKGRDGITEFTKDCIAEYANVSVRTIERNIKDLINMGYVCKRKDGVATKKKEKYIYYINPYFNTTAGFILLEKLLLKSMLEELTDGEIKLYTYLCKMVGAGGAECWASQKYLAKQIGKSRNAVSEMTDILQQKKYITKYVIEKNGVKHCIYNLEY